MDRREFSAGAACILASAGLGVPHLSFAQGKKPEDGVEYLTLDKRAPVDAPAGKIEVIEFFWYSCPHCNHFEPQLEAWIKKLPPDVAMRRVPVAFRDDMVPQQRLYYALETMGKVNEMQAKVFHAIHEDREGVNREESILAWAEKQGFDRAKFRDLYNSFSVSAKARRATQLQDMYKVTGVPAIGVAGRYYVDGELAHSMDRALQVTDYLIAETRKGK
ncbi:MAG: thiol:disulfide interchange protein DsbA/DsbL [Ramlibacter sp.]